MNNWSIFIIPMNNRSREMRRRDFLVTAGSAGVGATLFDTRALGKSPRDLPAKSIRGWPHRALLQPNMKDSMLARSLAKPVQRSAIIDDMSTDKGWTLEGAGSLSYDKRHVRKSGRSLVYSVPSRDEKYIADHRWSAGFMGEHGATGFMGERGSGSSRVTLKFGEPQDWSNYNRLAVWVYVEPLVEELTKYPYWLAFHFEDESHKDIGRGGLGGSPRAPYDHSPENFAEVYPNQWNYIVWEIPEFQRNRVTLLEIEKSLIGRTRKDGPTANYHFASFELQQVEPEQYEGWQVQPGRIAFHHVGHRPFDQKVAIVAAGGASTFEILGPSDKVAYSGTVQQVKTARGSYGVMDFSKLTTPGRYRIRTGAITSRAFSIGDDVWVDTLEKNLNTMYARRCGPEIVGVHPRCHFDIFVRYKGVKHALNGCWHDASDTHVNTNSTHQIIGSMMDVYRRLPESPRTSKLRSQLLEEICWGLDWSLKTRFGNGVRLPRILDRFYSDNIVGNADDVTFDAEFDPWYATIGAYTLAEASRLLAELDPDRAKRCRDAAIEDYDAVFSGKVDWTPPDPSHNASFDSYKENGAWAPKATVDIAYAVLASCAVHSLTGRASDAQRAAALADRLLSCQERGFDGSPLTGYFYESISRAAPLDEVLMSTQEGILLAFTRLCQEFPGHERWMDWYSAGAIYADFFQARAGKMNAPYDRLASAVWTHENFKHKVDEMLSWVHKPKNNTASWEKRVLSQYDEQIRGATPVSDRRLLRTFPIRTTNTFRTAFIPGGDGHPFLSVTAGLAALTSLHNNKAYEDFVKRQVQWLLGGNPFGQSLMYGVGYDYQEMFAYMCKSTVGSIPVGLSSYHNDAPWWGNDNMATPKEVWGICSGKLFYALAVIASPARISGVAPEGAVFTDAGGKRYPVHPGSYSLVVPPGSYHVSFGGCSKQVHVVGGTDIKVSLDPKSYIDAKLSGSADASGKVGLVADLTGKGNFELILRLYNADGDSLTKKVVVDGATTVDLPITILDPNQPWGAALFVAGEALPTAELFGTASSIPDVASNG